MIGVPTRQNNYTRRYTKMKFQRRMLAALLTIAPIFPATSANAQYPDKPIKIIVPFTAGGFSDNVARLIAKGLEERLGASTVVENKPGAGGNLGASLAARAPADGYTLFLANVASNAINPNIYKNLEIDPGKAFAPVSLVVKTPNVVAVNNDVAARSVAELIDLAKTNPGKLNFGTPGSGTSGHLTGEMFKAQAGIDLAHIPYKGTPQALSDLFGGRVQLTFDNVTTLAPQANAGRLRALAVTSSTRSPLLPNVPTLKESGLADFEATSWAGIVVPTGTPSDIVTTLNRAINAVIETPAFKAAMNGGEVTPLSPSEFGSFISDDRKRWGDAATAINLKLD